MTVAQLEPAKGPASPWQPQTACSFQRQRWQQSEAGPGEWCPHNKGWGVRKRCLTDSLPPGSASGGEAHPGRTREGRGEAGRGEQVADKEARLQRGILSALCRELIIC